MTTVLSSDNLLCGKIESDKVRKQEGVEKEKCHILSRLSPQIHFKNTLVLSADM